jgi:hypothetical protein
MIETCPILGDYHLRPGHKRFVLIIFLPAVSQREHFAQWEMQLRVLSRPPSSESGATMIFKAFGLSC